MPNPRKVTNQRERYQIASSPFAQKPTQREVAKLVREKRDDLRRLANFKEQFIVRRTTETGKDEKKKTRDLAYPEDRLRRVHERLKFHLNKVKQPSYLFSPRFGKSQRDNAELHAGQAQVLTMDLKQFYPSTTSAMVKKWLINELKMYPDVAALITRLATVDEKASFGSPLTPVLCTLVHRKMFDEIADLCAARNLRYSVWVDDITISGKFVPGELLNQIREVVRKNGLKTHKIRYRTNSRPIFVTGIGVVGDKLISPYKTNLRIKQLYSQYHEAKTLEEKEDCAQKLLSLLGSARFISGKDSIRGQKTVGQMNSLRQEIAVFRTTAYEKLVANRDTQYDPNDIPPFDL
jgi:RNA-directed DNA polymerase